MNEINEKTQRDTLTDSGLTDFFIGIYKWMTVGVLMSGIFAYLVVEIGMFSFIFSNPIFMYGLIGIELVIMLGIQFLIKKLSPSLALWLFLIYASLTGITLSVIFYAYEISSIIPTFAGAVALFIALAYFGFTTKKSLAGWGTFLSVSTFAIIFASLLNLFVFQNSIFDTLISAVVLLVFSGLTMYDNQAYQSIYFSVKGNEDEEKRYTILGALHMYINFIAIFQSLLNLFGSNE